MSILTLFTAPKPSTDTRIAAIQDNALASWSRLKDVDLILMGEGHTVAGLAKEHNARHIPDVRTNASGTPLISSMIELARRWGQGDLLGIINADIIVLNDLVEATGLVKSRLDRFVLLGRRWDLTVDGRLDFSGNWVQRLRDRVRETGRLHRPTGSDFFVFPKREYLYVPDFAVGRAGWDNWMIFSARQQGIPVVDCTEAAMLIHQNHDYAHLPGGVPHYAVPESAENVRLAGGSAAARFTILDATHRLSNGRLVRPVISRARLSRAIELALRRALFFLPTETLESIARPRRWRRRWQRMIPGSVSRNVHSSPDDNEPDAGKVA